MITLLATVMLVTTFYWWLYDGVRFKMFLRCFQDVFLPLTHFVSDIRHRNSCSLSLKHWSWWRLLEDCWRWNVLLTIFKLLSPTSRCHELFVSWSLISSDQCVFKDHLLKNYVYFINNVSITIFPIFDSTSSIKDLWWIWMLN